MILEGESIILDKTLQKPLILNKKVLSLQKERTDVMVKTKATKEETLAKFQAARERKRVCLAKLEKSMREAYKKRTGKEADTFFAL